MKIFVTGGTGFLGTAVCAALKGHDLRVLTRDAERAALLNQPWWYDLANTDRLGRHLRDFRPEVCIHLAWEGIPDFSPEMCQRNYDLTAGLFELLDCRTVAVGSCFEYGDLTGCVSEDMEPKNLSLFASTKRALRLYGERLFRQRGKDFLWVRPFHVYGPGQRKDSLIPSAYKALKAGETLTLRDPDKIHDFVHVDDVASGIAQLAVGQAPAGVYNLGAGDARPPHNAVNHLAFRSGRLGPFPGSEPYRLDTGFWADMTKTIQATNGWWPRYDLEEGIRQTVAAWENE